jgi:hypothetical protein
MTDGEVEFLAHLLSAHLRARFSYDRVAALIEEWSIENDNRKPGALDARVAAHPDYSHMIAGTDFPLADTPRGTISLAVARAKRRSDPDNTGGAA